MISNTITTIHLLQNKATKTTSLIFKIEVCNCASHKVRSKIIFNVTSFQQNKIMQFSVVFFQAFEYVAKY